MLYRNEKYDPQTCSGGDPWKEPDPILLMIASYLTQKVLEPPRDAQSPSTGPDTHTDAHMALERIVEMTPAFDRRDPDPSKNYGIGGVSLRMILKGAAGAIQFVVHTNWQLPHVTDEFKRKPMRDDIDLEVRWLPFAADVGYHSPVPQYEGQSPMDGECEYVEGGKCYYDGSSLQAEQVFRVLLEKGSDGVWKELERRYEDLFAQPAN